MDPLLKTIIWVALTKYHLQIVMGKLDQIHNVFILKVRNMKGRCHDKREETYYPVPFQHSSCAHLWPLIEFGIHKPVNTNF
jgi:hypothetical protein